MLPSLLLGRIACIAQMWPTATDVARTVWCFCLCARHMDELW